MTSDRATASAESVLEDEAATLALGRRLAGKLRPGDVVALKGDLGAGKSTFARACIRALGIEGAIPSPTFTLVQSYDLPAGGALGAVHHADLYRIGTPDEVVELALDDLLTDGALLVEWPENGGGVLPAPMAVISFSSGPDEVSRTVSIAGDQSWTGLLGRGKA